MDIDDTKTTQHGLLPIRINRYSFSDYEILCGIIRRLEFIVPLMPHHHLKTAILAGALGWELSLPQGTKDLTLQLALLHNIGLFTRSRFWEKYEKTYLSRRHRSSPARPTAGRPEELEIMQQILKWPTRMEHAYWGYRLLLACPDCNPIAKLVLYHAFPFQYLHFTKLDSQEQRIVSIVQIADFIALILSRESAKMSSNVAELPGALKKGVLSGKFDPELADFALSVLSRRRDLLFDMKHPDSWTFEFEPVLKSHGELTPDGLYALLKAISKFVDAKSPYTSQHTENVCRTAETIARHMKLPQNDIEKLKLAALMHDLGKLSTPAFILHKRGTLTEAETFEMQEHVYMTYLFFKDFVDLKEVLFVAITHHERLDGSGYPWGMKGPDLPLLSRILQVADVYAAMREDRPYRDGVAHEMVMRLLVEDARSGRLDPIPISFLGECAEELHDLPSSLSMPHPHDETLGVRS